MFRFFIDEILFEKIDLIILLYALFDSLGEILDTGHKRNFSFHFFPPPLSLDWLCGIDSNRPT